MTESTIREDWYADAFGPLYPVVYAHRTVESARREARFAIDTLDLGPADRVLDLCCGNGRHMVHLLEKTPHVTGLDYSKTLLDLARDVTGGAAPLVRGDMRTLPFCRGFDIVTSFFTSFGYFPRDAENRAVLAGVARVLTPRGRLFMDYLNPVQVAASLKPATERWNGNIHIVEERWINHEAGRVNKRTRVARDGALLGQSEESVRLYRFDEMAAFLREAGIAVERVWGDYDGSDYGEESPRMILAGRKG